MDWLLHKYIGLISPRLERFKRKGPTLYNFRCIFCGDSEHHKNKARGYIYQKEGKLMYHCHNCNVTMSVPKFIKSVDESLYQEYVLEKLKDEKTPEQKDLEEFVQKLKKPVFMTSGPLKGLKKISQLSHNSPIKQFIMDRKVPTFYHAKLFVCSNFKNYINSIIPNKFSKESLYKDETRILIPYIDKEKNVHAMNFRAIGKSPVKYIKAVLNENIPNLYGLDTVDMNKKVYVFEGEFDSMFIPNAIATGGGDLISAVNTLPKDKLVIVYDNEKRSSETIKKIDKAIMNGYSVCIWPDNLEKKDVNEMILSGLTSEFIKYIIDQNTYRDLAAKLALQKWSRV